MNGALRVGLICQPCKTWPPSQVQKYCGFLYDTVAIPCLRVPQDKADRALATIRYLRSGAATNRLSRLTLAVVVGLLQSLVDATPNRVGQTYLRRLYNKLHELDNPRNLGREHGPDFYYTTVDLTDVEWLDLSWWETALDAGLRHDARSASQTLLGITWGDGSGTGTGGTVQLVPKGGDTMEIEAWMGTWTPEVFHFSSNWKELRTLVHTLEREVQSDRLRGCTVFYFTDNLVTYYIAMGGSSTSPELHKLIRTLKQLEIRLDVTLEVVHVPGTHMIDQQTDGLSRGLPLSISRCARDPMEETLRLFRRVPISWDILHLLADLTQRPSWA